MSQVSEEEWEKIRKAILQTFENFLSQIYMGKNYLTELHMFAAEDMSQGGAGHTFDTNLKIKETLVTCVEQLEEQDQLLAKILYFKYLASEKLTGLQIANRFGLTGLWVTNRRYGVT